MGVLNFVGKVVLEAVNTLWSAAEEANGVRLSSGDMSDRDLVKGAMDKNKKFTDRIGYMQAYKDRHQK